MITLKELLVTRIPPPAEIEAKTLCGSLRDDLHASRLYAMGFHDAITWYQTTAPVDVDLAGLRSLIMEHGRAHDLDTLTRVMHLAAVPR